MLSELDVVVFLASSDDLENTAKRIFGALGSHYQYAESEDWGGPHYQGSGLGFRGVLFANSGEMLDPEFERYSYALELSSDFWCVDLDTIDLEGPLSEYYARMLAFELNLETATEVLIDTTEELEIFKIMAYRRNPQFRLDQAPTTPRVFMIEERQVERPFEDEDWDETIEDEVEAGERT